MKIFRWDYFKYDKDLYIVEAMAATREEAETKILDKVKNDDFRQAIARFIGNSEPKVLNDYIYIGSPHIDLLI